MLPEISVIIPAYNCQDFIEKAIRSVLDDQEYKSIELLIVDDDSTDATADIVKKLQKSYSQITLCRNIRNHGPSGSRNTGLLKARGEYIGFLDADDIWLPGHLKRGLHFLRHNVDVDVIFFNFNIVDYATQNFLTDWFSQKKFSKSLKSVEMSDGYHLIQDDIFDALLKDSFLHLQSMILRKQVCDNILFDENVKRSEDRDFGIRLYVFAGARFAFKDVVTGTYYRHRNSLTANNIDNSLYTLSDHIYLFNNYLDKYARNKGQINYLKSELYKKYLSKAYFHRTKSEFNMAVCSLRQSAKYKFGVDQVEEFLKILIAWSVAHILGKWKLKLTKSDVV